MVEIHFDISQITKISYHPEENLGLIRIPRTPHKQLSEKELAPIALTKFRIRMQHLK